MKLPILLDSFVIPEIKRVLNDGYDWSSSCEAYLDESLLEDVYKITAIVARKKQLPVEAAFGHCGIDDSINRLGNIFGYRYNHGKLYRFGCKAEFKALKKKYCGEPFVNKYGENFRKMIGVYNKEFVYPFHYNILKPKQDECLNRLKIRYLHPEILSSVLALGIDPKKFWYLLLWLKDYIDTIKVTEEEYEVEPIRDLEKLRDSLMSLRLEDSDEEEYMDKYLDSFRKKSRLEVNLDGDRVRIENPDTLWLLGKIVKEYIDKYSRQPDCEEWSLLHNRRAKFSNTASENPFDWHCSIQEMTDKRQKRLKTFVFKTILELYLSRFKGESRHKIDEFVVDDKSDRGEIFEQIRKNRKLRNEGYYALTDKNLLICRLAIIFEYWEQISDFDDNKGLEKSFRSYNAPNHISSTEYGDITLGRDWDEKNN